MGSVAIWLAAILPSMVARVIASLGMGVITVTGFTLAWDTVKNLIITNFQGLPADVLALAGLAGVGTGLGIIFGAITARVSYSAIMSAAKIGGMT